MKTLLKSTAIFVAAVTVSTTAEAGVRGVPVMRGHIVGIPVHGPVFGIPVRRPIYGVIVRPMFPRGIVVYRPFFAQPGPFGGFPGPFVRGVPVERAF